MKMDRTKWSQGEYGRAGKQVRHRIRRKEAAPAIGRTFIDSAEYSADRNHAGVRKIPGGTGRGQRGSEEEKEEGIRGGGIVGIHSPKAYTNRKRETSPSKVRL